MSRVQHPGTPRGQAIIEFAIILIVLSMLVAGGMELAVAAYNGHRIGEGAKAGAVEWMERLASHAFYLDDTDGFVLGGSTDPGLGDHEAIANFQRPSCISASDYDFGLPADGMIYLYNPLPLDITNCSGMDDNGTPGDSSDDSRSRVSVLVAGRGQEGTPGYLPGLPMLNRAIYSHYQEACIDVSAAPNTVFISCGKDFDPGNPGHRRILHLPGWLDFAGGEMSRLVSYDASNSLTSKPVFALQCARNGTHAFETCDSASLPADICWSSISNRPLACDVQVQLRYRHIFESLVMMGMSSGPENVPASEEQYFSSDAEPVGVLGSELAQTRKTDQRALASRLKAHKDFLGCYVTASATRLAPPKTISTATWASGVATFTAPSHGYAVGARVEISGIAPAGYNGAYYIASIIDANTFQLNLVADPGAYVSGGEVRVITGMTGINVRQDSACAYPGDPVP